MPIFQNLNEQKRAANHIQWLTENFNNVSSKTIDLNNVFTSFKNSIKDNKNNLLSLANSRSRLRMTTLYYFANLNNHLVTGTGNKVEDFGVGFYTKYGDGGVDISPIADCNKSEVWEMGKELGILKEIIEAAPTDGLWDDGRTDEDQIGATYDELEWAMMEVENPSGDVSTRQREVLQIYQGLHKANSHKMNPIPVFKFSVHRRVYYGLN